MSWVEVDGAGWRWFTNTYSFFQLFIVARETLFLLDEDDILII